MLIRLSNDLAEYFYDVFVTRFDFWLAFGVIAQVLFGLRFIVQWIASERARRSIVPETFWYFSLVGGAMLFAYAIYRLDPVFMLGQGMGLLIYARNIYFIRTHHRATALAAEQPAGRAG